MNVGENIVMLRESRNVSQKELAQHLGLHNSVMNRIERGLRPVHDDEIVKLADFFGVPADYILGRHGKTQDRFFIANTDDSHIWKELQSKYEVAPVNIKNAINSLLGLRPV